MFEGIQPILYLDWTVGLDLYIGHGNEWLFGACWFGGLVFYGLGSIVIAIDAIRFYTHR